MIVICTTLRVKFVVSLICIWISKLFIVNFFLIDFILVEVKKQSIDFHILSSTKAISNQCVSYQMSNASRHTKTKKMFDVQSYRAKKRRKKKQTALACVCWTKKKKLVVKFHLLSSRNCGEFRLLNPSFLRIWNKKKSSSQKLLFDDKCVSDNCIQVLIAQKRKRYKIYNTVDISEFPRSREFILLLHCPQYIHTKNEKLSW